MVNHLIKHKYYKRYYDGSYQHYATAFDKLTF